MSDAYWHAFFRLHADLPREGPGEADDVAWAAGIAGLRPDAAVCDAACGPGADLPAWRAAVPGGSITAFDLHPPFVDAAAARMAGDPRIRVLRGRLLRDPNDTLPDPRDLGRFDLIWCAGAVYLLGIEACLAAWRDALAPGGVIAFSDAVWLTDAPDPDVRRNWAEYPGMTDAAGVAARITAAGYETLATRPVSDAAWEAYYTPIDARIAALRPGADDALLTVLDEAAREAALWRAHRGQFGYLLSVVRPV
ncbi:MAG: class I SAM-dependent methyltransferase [Pseudomonadota bacterium]